MPERKEGSEQFAGNVRDAKLKRRAARHSSGLSLREWEIWHSYASFYSDPLPPLERIAENLVVNGLAESAFCSDGQAFWSNDSPAAIIERAGRRLEPVGTGQVEIDLKQDRVRATVHLPKGPRGYALETLYQSSMMRYKELMLFGDASLPARYLRAHLGACVLIEAGPKPSSLLLYPQLKIFETGVVLVQFRLMGPSRPVRTDEFIRKYLNAPVRDFRRILVPPGVAAWAPVACPSEGQFRWYRRARAAWLIRYHQMALSNHIPTEDAGDFVFPVVSLNLPTELEHLNRAAKNALPAAIEAGQRAVREERARVSPSIVNDSASVRAPGINSPMQADTKSREQRLLAAGMRAAERVIDTATQDALRELPNTDDSFHTVALTFMAIAGQSHKEGPPIAKASRSSGLRP